MYAARLSREHEPAVRRLLGADPIQNLFLLGQLDPRTLERPFWYGAFNHDVLTGVVFYPGERLAVPWAPNPSAAAAVGAFLPPLHDSMMLVGPRLAVDALWSTWGRGLSPHRSYDQRLYVCDNAPSTPSDKRFRLARLDDSRVIAAYAGEMEREDLGRNPADEEPEAHHKTLRERILNGRVWVLECDGEIAFQINVGASHAGGVQVGGTYVPPKFRGTGIATHAMRLLNQELLKTHQFVTLHVNEANVPAVRTYEKSWFKRYSPFRLMTITAPPEDSQ